MQGESAKQVTIDVLRAAGEPLHTKEITKRVLESGRSSRRTVAPTWSSQQCAESVRLLEGLSKWLEPSEAEDRAGEAEERLVDLGVGFVVGAEPAKVVQVREAALDDPALPAEIGAVFGSAPGDDELDAARPEQPPFLGAATSVMRSSWFVGGRGLPPGF